MYTRQSAVKTSFYFAPYSHLPHCSTLLRLGEAIPEKPFFLNQFFFFKRRLPLLIRFGHSPTIYSLKCKSKLSAHVQTDYYHNFFITSFTLVLIITGRAIACWLWETTTTLYSVTLLVSTWSDDQMAIFSERFEKSFYGWSNHYWFTQICFLTSPPGEEHTQIHSFWSFDHMIIWSNDHMIIWPYDHVALWSCDWVYEGHCLVGFWLQSDFGGGPHLY